MPLQLRLQRGGADAGDFCHNTLLCPTLCKEHLAQTRLWEHVLYEEYLGCFEGCVYKETVVLQWMEDIGCTRKSVSYKYQVDRVSLKAGFPVRILCFLYVYGEFYDFSKSG